MIFIFLRTVKNNQRKEYLRIVESYRENGKTKQRIVANLGRVDTISPREVENIIKKFVEIFEIRDHINIKEVEESGDKKNYGIRAIVDKLFEKYNMNQFFEKLDKKVQFDVEELLKIMVMNRILEPRSKLGIYNNLEYYGFKRIEGEEGIALQWLYRTLDVLSEKKEEIEKHMYNQRINLFNSKVDIVFYDVTTLSFETQQRNEVL